MTPTLHVVHCVDTEGPLDEDIDGTFQRLEDSFGVRLDPTPENLEEIQTGRFSTGNHEIDRHMRLMCAPELLKYNRTWDDIDEMNRELFSDEFRLADRDDFGNGWKISWFCMDHVNYASNPRKKALGFGAIHNYYADLTRRYPDYGDELQFHHHPKSISGNPLAAATSYTNSMSEIVESLARRIIDNGWFPSAYRPGFHAERSDCNLFLEQWIPFDYGNQSHEQFGAQPDEQHGRFGDWAGAPTTWRGYHPDIHDYKIQGDCRRTIFRCLNVGTRLRLLEPNHVTEAFVEARESGNAILAFADHDFRDIRKDVQAVRMFLERVRAQYPDVNVRYSGADEAANDLVGNTQISPCFDLSLDNNRLIIRATAGLVFGAQPFFAIKLINGTYIHDNLDNVVKDEIWSYAFDEQTIRLSDVDAVGLGTAGRQGNAVAYRYQLRNGLLVCAD